MINPLDVAQTILDTLVEGFADTAQTPAVALPTRQYVPEGRLAPADGEQFTVAFVNLTRGMPGQPDGPPNLPAKWCATFEAELLRKRKAGLANSGGRQTALPTLAQSTTAGESFGADLAKMLEALQRMVNVRTLGHWSKVGTGPIEPVGPDGDLVGIKATVTVLLL